MLRTLQEFELHKLSPSEVHFLRSLQSPYDFLSLPVFISPLVFLESIDPSSFFRFFLCEFLPFISLLLLSEDLPDQAGIVLEVLANGHDVACCNGQELEQPAHLRHHIQEREAFSGHCRYFRVHNECELHQSVRRVQDCLLQID